MHCFFDFVFNLIGKFRIVGKQLLYGITSLSDFGVAIAEP